MQVHPLSALDEEQRRSILSYYRQQEKGGSLTIKSTDFQDGELLVVNYTDQYNEKTPPTDWDWQMELARGSVFFKRGGSAPEVVVQAMPKFHGYTHCPEAMQHIAENGSLQIMQKHDGSCIALVCFRGEVLIFTRGSRHNLQTQLARQLLSETSMAALAQMEGRTFAMELIHSCDGKVEQNRGPDRLVLLYACEATGHIVPVAELGPIAKTIGVDCAACQDVTGRELMRRVEALNSVTLLADMREGFVVEISGRKYKVKPQLYKTLAGRSGRGPQPSQAWMNRCIVNSKNMAEVHNEVENMQRAPLDYGILARGLFEQHLASADETFARLRSLHSSFPGPKELNQSQALSKADKNLLFLCLRLPAAERDAWFDGDVCRFAVAQSLAKNSLAAAERARSGFPVGRGRLVLCGAPGKKAVDSWAEGLDCVVTLLRETELRDRGLDLIMLCEKNVEWMHLPVSGAALAEPEDHVAVQDAARAVAERLSSGKTIAVHCSAGLHRTGLVGYLALRLLGWSMAGSFELLGQIRFETRAELENIYYRRQSAAPGGVANLIAVAEEMLLKSGSMASPVGSEGSST